MPDLILVVSQMTRLNNRPIGDLRIARQVAAREGTINRGLFIGDCADDCLIRRVSWAVMNGLPARTVVVPASYNLGFEIAQAVKAIGCNPWVADRCCNHVRAAMGTAVQIAVPEKLHLLEKRKGHGGIRPELIHVVDPQGYMSSRYGAPWKTGDCRASNIGRFRAAAMAEDIHPYVILWTGCQPANRNPELLSAKMGVEAWQYADGRTVRTAGVARACA